MSRRMVPLSLALAAVVCAFPAMARSADTETPWSSPVNEISARLKIDRAEAFPGEVVRITPEVKAAGDRPLALPTRGLTPVGTLHIKTPSGEHFILDYGLTKLNGRWQRYKSFRIAPARPGKPRRMGKHDIILLDQPKSWRLPDGTKVEAAWSLRTPGEYEFWYELTCEPGWPRDPQGGGQSPQAWIGHVVSDRLVLTVRPLTEDAMQEPTQEELDALQVVREGLVKHDKAVINRAIKVLKTAMARATCDGLARTMVDLLRQEKPDDQAKADRWYQTIDHLVWRRAWHNRQIRFEGPYLRPYVDLQLSILTEWCEQGPPAKGSRHEGFPRGAHVALAYAVRSDDPELRRQLVALATKYARLHPAALDKGYGAQGYFGNRVGFAWRVLTEFDVLIGMSKEEVVKIMGPPTREANASMTWIYEWDFRIMGPRLTAGFVDGRVASVR